MKKFVIVDTEYTRAGRVYDFAAIVCDAQGVEYESMHCLIAETLQDVSAMCTSYYNNKMPLYLAQLANAQVQITTWNDCRTQFITMCDNWGVDIAYAYNESADRTKCDKMTNGDFMPAPFAWVDLAELTRRTICTRASFILFAIKNGLVSEKTSNVSCSADTVLKYLRGMDYQEEHTALSDCRDELAIFLACHTMRNNCNGRQEVNSEQAIIELILQSL